MSESVSIEVTVNGRTYCRSVEPRVHLADFLRQELGLTGTHVGCEQGVCGNCTVMLGDDAVKSCLLFAVQVDGMQVTTVEGLASGEALSVLQQSFKDAHALQCGFCTPGFLMTATALARRDALPRSRSQLRDELAGVICRCTGYENIITAVERYLEDTPTDG
ncbi:MAG: (2Fe-2S)-binding protein [Solirubrobacteraceae bacterium]|nr:(2Fe-2S)-binding protein [Solirubrobacteraceae bacterium]